MKNIPIAHRGEIIMLVDKDTNPLDPSARCVLSSEPDKELGVQQALKWGYWDQSEDELAMANQLSGTTTIKDTMPVIDLTTEENDDWLKLLDGGKHREEELAIHAHLAQLESAAPYTAKVTLRPRG